MVELRIVDVEVGRKVWVWSVHRPSNTSIVGVVALHTSRAALFRNKGGFKITPSESSSSTRLHAEMGTTLRANLIGYDQAARSAR